VRIKAAAKRYPHATVFGLNPAIHRTDIRNNFFGEGSLKSRVVEWMIGLWTTSPETYAKRLTPLLVSRSRGAQRRDVRPEGQRHSAVAEADERVSYVKSFIAASEALVAAGANVRVSSKRSRAPGVLSPQRRQLPPR